MLDHVDVVVPYEGEDKGKVFRIKPMSAWKAEKWAWRAMGVLARSGMDLPPVELMGNFVVVAAYGLEALFKASFEEAEPLLDEMMSCVFIVPDPANFPNVDRSDIEHDIKVPSTILWLRDQVLEAHTGFSVAAALSNLRALATATSGSSANIPMSPQDT